MQESARGKWAAASFLLRSDLHRYGKLIEELANDFNKGRCCYPKNLTEAYELMLHDSRGHANRTTSHGLPGIAFSTIEDLGATETATGTKTQSNPRPDITCHRCDKTGHFAHKCREIVGLDGTVLTTQGLPGGSNGNEEANETAHTSVHFGEGVQDEVQFINDGKVHSQHKGATGELVPRT